MLGLQSVAILDAPVARCQYPRVAAPPERELLLDVAARASTLAERMAGAVELVPGDEKVVKRRLARWSENVAMGDSRVFETRLDLDGIDAERAARLVGDARWIGRAPKWALFIGEGLNCAGGGEGDRDRCLPRRDEDQIPLQELVVPFVRAARERLAAAAEASTSGFEPEALRDLERELLHQLSHVATPVGELEFRLWRRRRLDRLEEALIRAGGDPGRSLYDAWIGELRRGGLRELLRRYPVLARQVATVALGWVEATAELIERLEGDRDALADAFANGLPLGPVVAAAAGLSDPHRGRRGVVACTFASGLRLAYKPKSLTSESVYGRLLGWLNAHGADPPLRALEVLDRGNHGWVTWAEHEGIADTTAARRYFRRAGMVLCLLYAIGAKDCHSENVVAAGENPVIVDLETLLHPVISPEDTDPDAFAAAIELFAGSVLGVALLPDWMIGRDGRALDVSGLGGIEPQPLLSEIPVWESPNSDVARVVMKSRTREPQKNALRMGEEAQPPESYSEELCDGFHLAYEILQRHGGELLEPGGILADLEKAPVRVVLRATANYARAAAVACVPERMRFGIDHSIELESLGRSLLDGPEPSRYWDVHRREQADLEATDVPYFAAPGDAEALFQGDEGVAIVGFREAALAAARRQLESLSDDDERLQLAFIRAALGTRSHSPARSAVPSGMPTEPDKGDPFAAAFRLGEELEASAITSDGSVAWVGLTLSDQGERWNLRPTGADLYEGAVGIGLFLAALATATGEARWRALTLAALRPTLDQVERNAHRMAVGRGIGGATGTGGTLYGLVLAAALLEDERLLAAAQRLAGALPPAAIERDGAIDVLGGAAGLVCALLALDRVAGGDERAVELARHAGSVLAARLTELRDGDVTSTPAGDRMSDGFSHGSSGIMLALARLSARTGQEDHLGLITSSVVHTSDRFDPSLGGWPDPMAEGELRKSNSWCHGSAGIGLGRLGLLEQPLSEEIAEIAERDVDRARQALIAEEPRLDHLCCGAAGGIEFLSELASVTGDAETRAHAESRAAALAARVLDGGAVRLNRPEADVPSPGLFQGTAGIGMALLRTAVPGLPSVLSWR